MIARNLSSTEQVALPLHMAQAGETVELVKIRSCATVKKRLVDLGLTPGMSFRVVQRCASGGLIIAVRHDSRLALSQTIAEKIWVR